MLKRFSWKKNDVYAIQLKKDLYILAQLLDTSYIAFFDIVSEKNDFEIRTIDLGSVIPFRICTVLKTFVKMTAVGRVKGIIPNLNISVPEFFISEDKDQYLEELSGNFIITDENRIFNLVRIDPITGSQGELLGDNEIVRHNINKYDPEINDYEMRGYNVGYELIRCLILSLENNKWIDPLKDKELFGIDNYPLKTKEEMWDYGVPDYQSEKEEKQSNLDNKKFSYLAEMYNDSFFPNLLVDQIKLHIEDVVQFLEKGTHNKVKAQEKLDEMTEAINGLQNEFAQNGSEIETGARESIGQTIEEILQHFKIDISVEEATRKRDW